jgi:hypothetical protein
MQDSQLRSEYKDSDYVVEMEGIGTVPITLLSREHLIQELRRAMDKLEDLDEILHNAISKIHDWRYSIDARD